MILASLITTLLSSPWMAALGTALLVGNLTQGMKDGGKRLLIIAVAATIGAAVVYPIHKSIKEENKEPAPIRLGESLSDYNRRVSGR